MEAKDTKGGKWYPGKYAGRSQPAAEEKKSGSFESKDDTNDEDSEKKGWYPGKLMSKAARRVSTTSSTLDDRRQSVRPISSIQDSPGGSEKVYHESTVPTERRKPQFDLLDNVGKVRIRLPGIRYINISNATFLVELEDLAAFFEYNADSYNEFDRTFDLKDITSDIVISIGGIGTDGLPTAGIIVIPIVSCLGFNGKPAAPKEIWRQVFPIYTKSKADNFKFTSGFSEPQGYALTKPKESLGFVSAIVELNLYTSPLAAYFAGEPKFHLTEYVLEQLSDHEKSPVVVDEDDALSLALVKRNFQRLQDVAVPLSCISPVLHMPEVFILVGLVGFFCYSLQTHELPIFFFCLTLFNGIYTKMNRNFGKVLIWNDPVFNSRESPAPASMRIRSVSQADATSMQSVLGLIAASSMGGVTSPPPPVSQKNIFSVYSRHLHAVVHYLEVFMNLSNFSDSRISLIWYAFLFAVCLVSSIFLAISSIRALIMVVVSSLLLSYAARDVLYDYFYFRIKSPKDEKSVRMMQRLTAINCFFSKVPDELDLIHRYIAGVAVVNEKGAEMLDAAAAFKK